MRIKEIYIDAFGMYQQFPLYLDKPSSAITVIYGPNEAGKSTLHSFISSMLFGFQLRGYPDYGSLAGETLGGRMILEDGGTVYHLERRVPPKNGKAVLYLEDGRQEGEAYLKWLLGNIPAPLFTSIFSFRHHELQRLETLQGKEIADTLFSAALGRGASSLLETEKQMSKLRDQLFKPRASRPTLNQVLKDVEEHQLHVEKMKHKLSTYTPVKQRLEQQKEELLHWRQQRERLEEQRKHYEILWKVIDLKQQWQELEEEGKKLAAYPKPLLPDKESIQALFHDQKRIKEKEKECFRLEEARQQKYIRVNEYLSLLGVDWDIEKIKKADISISLHDKLVQLARQKEQAAESYFQANRNYEQRKAELERESALTEIKNKEKLALLSLGLTFSLPPLLAFGLGQILAAVILFCSLVWFSGQLWFKQQERRLKRKQLLQDVTQLDRDKHRLAEELEELSHVLKRELLSLHISADLSSEGLAHFLQTLRNAHTEVLHLEEIKLELKNIREEVNAWRGKVEELALSLGEESESIHHPYILLEKAMEQVNKEEEVYRQTELLRSQQKQISWQIDKLLISLEGEMPEQVRAFSDKLDTEEVHRQLTKLDKEYHNILQKIEALAMDIGNLEREVKDLEDEGEFSLQLQELEEKKTAFQGIAKKWAVYSLAEQLCQQIRKMYEEERQPTVLREASLFFQKMTLGRYTQIIIPFGQQDVMVIRADQQRLGVHQLSQGTVEQLYLAMRFAVIRDFEKIASLPVIMDDIFVNFDSNRVKAALRGLQELSSSHQIILFTCHEHLMHKVQEIMGNAHIIAVNSSLQREEYVDEYNVSWT